jgi:hypothetical protein
MLVLVCASLLVKAQMWSSYPMAANAIEFFLFSSAKEKAFPYKSNCLLIL